MQYEKEEPVIFVKDLLFAALYQWRRILVFSLSLALVLGGLAALIQKRNAANIPSPEAIQAQMEAYTAKRELLKEAVADAAALVERQELYNRDSVLMSLDPYSVYKASMELTVQATTPEDVDSIGAILRAYEAYLGGDQVIHSAAQAIELESKYLWELVAIKNGGNETRSLNISISYPTAEGAQTLLDLFLGYLDQAKQQVAQSVGKHSIHVVTSSVDQRIDLTVTNKQVAAQERLTSLQQKLDSATSALNALAAPSYLVTFSVKRVVLLAVIGGILGAGLIACVAWFRHISADKVYSHRTLRNKTSLKILGCVASGKTTNPVDRWLKKLEGRSLGEEQLEIATATVCNYCPPNTRLLLVGDCSPSDMQPLVQALTTAGVPLTAWGNLLKCPETLHALPESDLVLFVEKCGYSSYSHVLQSMELVSDQNKTLIGCVVLDG